MSRRSAAVNAQGDPNLSDIYTNNLPEVHGVMRRLRAMTDSYPGERVLIGETYVPKTADLDAWYGGALHNELQLPMDTLVRPRQQARRQHLPPAPDARPRPQLRGSRSRCSCLTTTTTSAAGTATATAFTTRRSPASSPRCC